MLDVKAAEFVPQSPHLHVRGGPPCILALDLECGLHPSGTFHFWAADEADGSSSILCASLACTCGYELVLENRSRSRPLDAQYLLHDGKRVESKPETSSRRLCKALLLAIRDHAPRAVVTWNGYGYDYSKLAEHICFIDHRTHEVETVRNHMLTHQSAPLPAFASSFAGFRPSAIQAHSLVRAMSLVHPTIVFVDALAVTRERMPMCFPNYKLDTVARQLLGLGKLESPHFQLAEYQSAAEALRQQYQLYCLFDSKLALWIWMYLHRTEGWSSAPHRVAHHP